MEEDDDDFYSGVQQVAEEADETFAPTGADAVVENEQMDTGEQLDEDDEEDEDVRSTPSHEARAGTAS